MGCIACFAFLAVYMSDRVDSFSVPPSFDVDFDVPPYWSLACRGQSYARAKIGGTFSGVGKYLLLLSHPTSAKPKLSPLLVKLQ